MTPGQAAYTAWRDRTIAALARGGEESHLAAWKGLPESAIAAWEEIAEAAITAYEDPEGLGPIARDMEPEELEKLIKASGMCEPDDPSTD